MTWVIKGAKKPIPKRNGINLSTLGKIFNLFVSRTYHHNSTG